MPRRRIHPLVVILLPFLMAASVATSSEDDYPEPAPPSVSLDGVTVEAPLQRK